SSQTSITSTVREPLRMTCVAPVRKSKKASMHSWDEQKLVLVGKVVQASTSSTLRASPFTSLGGCRSSLDQKTGSSGSSRMMVFSVPARDGTDSGAATCATQCGLHDRSTTQIAALDSLCRKRSSK